MYYPFAADCSHGGQPLSHREDSRRYGGRKPGSASLGEEEQVREVGRLMGGVEITQTILDSADEMKKMAEQFRKTCLKN